MSFFSLKSRRSSFLAVMILASLLYCLWATKFIANGAVTWNGLRYFSLFDDQMISMRFAWNLVHHHGLTWNAGEHVEGYTNPAWTLLMSAAIALFGDRFAPLAIQLIGGICEIGAVWFLVWSARLLVRQHFRDGVADIRTALWTLFLLACFYPLHFACLSGMEVAPLALLTAVSIFCALSILLAREADRRDMLVITICGIASYFLRPDGFINIVLPFSVGVVAVYRRSRWRALKPALLILIVGVILACAHLVWREAYYGALVPNTYTLKVEGYGLAWRLANGLIFMRGFVYVYAAALLGGLVAASVTLRTRFTAPLLLLASPILPILYQIYVGGDPWPIYRQLVPAVAVFFTGCAAIITLVLLKDEGNRSFQDRCYRTTIVAAALVAAAIPNIQAWRSLAILGPPYQYDTLSLKVREGLALREIMKPQGRVLVFWSGALPYFWQGSALDALGKSDAYIAHLLPHHVPEILDMKGPPGHSKYDLAYDIVRMQPDFIEGASFGADDQSTFVSAHYLNAIYRGVRLCLKKDSSNVTWPLVQVSGPCTVG
jgi:arabinofuranosyltransferase